MMSDASTEERLRDTERQLERIIVLLESLTQKVDAHVAQSAATSARLQNTLYGDGGSPGMFTRMDRLEQAAERQRWLTRAVVTGLVALLVRAAFETLAGS